MDPSAAGNPRRVILGYPDDPTVRAGGRLVLRVSTDAPAFRVVVRRWGAAVETVAEIGPLPGGAAPRGRPCEDWDWPGHTVDVPAAWRPGVYVAVLVEEGARDAGAPDARTGRALFVVRGARAPILYKLPLFTWHAYNTVLPADGWSLYDPPGGDEPAAVSVRRPGGGVGGTPFDVFNRDPFDPTPRHVRVGFRVQHADHWVFAGSGLRDGDVLGEREYVVGYEADGAHFDRSRWTPRRPAEPTGDDGTPPGFTILGVGDIAPSGWGNGNAAATTGLHTTGGGGTVFTGATVDWPRVVAAGTCPPLERVTRTVLDRLAG